MKAITNGFIGSVIAVLIVILTNSCKPSGSEQKDTSDESVSVNSGNLEDFQGAWKATTDSSSVVRVYQDNYFSTANYNEESKTFHGTYGGQWSVKDGKYFEVQEFNTFDSTTIGDTIFIKVEWLEGAVSIAGQAFSAIDRNEPGKLAGAWLFSGRKSEGEITRRQPGPRKTMKILSGTRFQWIAYNVETKEFFGTGGGTYTSEAGQYIETIDFFSRDSSRVGAVLPFNFELIDGDWHHTGNSSKGDPIHELWALRKVLGE